LQNGKDRKFMVSAGQQYGNWALVAGAAEGLGEGFCTVLASMGFNLIMVDRNEDAMNKIAGQLSRHYGIQFIALPLDLARQDAAAVCMASVHETCCRLMVYVAAWSRVCRFTNLTDEDLDGFLNVNTRTMIFLVHQFSKKLQEEQKTGGIILISSLAGLIGPRYVATYAATKSFAIRLAESLHGELSEKGIDIMACCAGTTSTPTYWKSNPSFEKMKPPVMQPQEVAHYALAKLGIKVIAIPGFINRLQYWFLMNLIPRSLARYLVHDAMTKMYGNR